MLLLAWSVPVSLMLKMREIHINFIKNHWSKTGKPVALSQYHRHLDTGGPPFKLSLHAFQVPRPMWYTLTWIGLVYPVESIGLGRTGWWVKIASVGSAVVSKLRLPKDVKVPGISDLDGWTLDGQSSKSWQRYDTSPPRDVFLFHALFLSHVFLFLTNRNAKMK